jgi:hypothetical protein
MFRSAIKFFTVGAVIAASFLLAPYAKADIIEVEAATSCAMASSPTI